MNSLIEKYQIDLDLCSRQKQALKNRENELVMELFHLRKDNAKGTVFASQIERKKENFQCNFRSNGFMPPRSSIGGGGSLEASLVEIVNRPFATEMRQIEQTFEITVNDVLSYIQSLESGERQRNVLEVNQQLINRFRVNNALLRELDDVPFDYEDLSGDEAANAVLEKSRQLRNQLIRDLREMYQDDENTLMVRNEMNEDDVRLADENTLRVRNEMKEQIKYYGKILEKQKIKNLEFDRTFEIDRQLWAEENNKRQEELRLLLEQESEFNRKFQSEGKSKRKPNKVVHKRNFNIYMKRHLIFGLLTLLVFSGIFIMIMKKNLNLKQNQMRLSVVAEGLMKENDELRSKNQKEIELCNTVVKAQLVELKQAHETLAQATDFVYDFEYSVTEQQRNEVGTSSGLLSFAAIFAMARRNIFGK